MKIPILPNGVYKMNLIDNLKQKAKGEQKIISGDITSDLKSSVNLADTQPVAEPGIISDLKARLQKRYSGGKQKIQDITGGSNGNGNGGEDMTMAAGDLFGRDVQATTPRPLSQSGLVQSDWRGMSMGNLIESDKRGLSGRY